MSNLYHLESERSTWINLDSDIEFLKSQQARLQEQMAKVARDIGVITNAIVRTEEVNHEVKPIDTLPSV